jgi:diketogulonate reductase-like aldo/keto reductase
MRGGRLGALAKHKNATPAQVAIAWLLKRSGVMVPIFGTSSATHLEENVAAAAMKLSDDEFLELDRMSRWLGYGRLGRKLCQFIFRSSSRRNLVRFRRGASLVAARS